MDDDLHGMGPGAYCVSAQLVTKDELADALRHREEEQVCQRLVQGAYMLAIDGKTAPKPGKRSQMAKMYETRNMLMFRDQFTCEI